MDTQKSSDKSIIDEIEWGSHSSQRGHWGASPGKMWIIYFHNERVADYFGHGIHTLSVIKATSLLDGGPWAVILFVSIEGSLILKSLIHIGLTHFQFCLISFPSQHLSELESSLQGWKIIMSFKDATWPAHTSAHPQNSAVKLTANCMSLGHMSILTEWEVGGALERQPKPLVLRVSISQKGCGVSPQLCTHQCITWITPAASCQCQRHRALKKNNTDSNSRGRN